MDLGPAPHTVVVSFLLYVLYTTSMVRIKAGTTPILTACGEPPVTAIFGVLLFSEVLSHLITLGIILTVDSMALIWILDHWRTAEAS